MPKVHLRATFVADPPIPDNKPKIDYFDTHLPGFLLEVRCTGNSTYYLRYRDKSGQIKQFRIGNSKSIGLEEARNKARAMKKQTVIGFDPREVEKRLKAVPTFRVFVNDHYLPHVKTEWCQVF